MNENIILYYLGLPDSNKDILKKVENLNFADKNWLAKFNTVTSKWTYFVDTVYEIQEVGYLQVTLLLPGIVRTGVATIGKGGIKGASYNALVSAFKTLISTVKDDSDDDIEDDTKDDTKETKPSKYSKEQISAMKKFRKDYGADSNKELLAYYKSWDKSIRNTKEFTPDMVEPFLKWIDENGNEDDD